MEKTALTILKEHINEIGIKQYPLETLELIEKLLEVEKQQIIDAYESGKENEYQYHINCDPNNYNDVLTSEQYYELTHTTKK